MAFIGVSLLLRICLLRFLHKPLAAWLMGVSWQVVTWDVIIIGAGPAGLAAAHGLKAHGCSVLVIDEGKDVHTRSRDLASEVTRGQGGAGLFSDGKFSFFPSASGLWQLPQANVLRRAYDWLRLLLTSMGLDVPDFPSDKAFALKASGSWLLKEYPSTYMSLESRIELIRYLVETSGAQFLMQHQVDGLIHPAPSDSVGLSVTDHGGVSKTLCARRLILATGRFGTLRLSRLTRHRRFLRLEAGMRIEQPATQAFFKDMALLDPKYWLRTEHQQIEWRTFCACRNGQVVPTETGGLWSVSGRADGPPTERSNIGFNTRILDEGLAARILPDLLNRIAAPNTLFAVRLADVVSARPDALNSVDAAVGTELRCHMVAGLKRLINDFPEIADDATVLRGPTFEGIGWYPVLDGALRFLDMPIWAAGDVGGLFRGIVAAMVSGQYVAHNLLNDVGVAA